MKMETNSSLGRIIAGLAVAAILVCGAFAWADAPVLEAPSDSFVGNWALNLPGDVPGWLGIASTTNGLDGSMLWGWASPFPVEQVAVKNQTLSFVRVRTLMRKDETGKLMRTDKLTDKFSATIEGDLLKFTVVRPHDNDAGVDTQEFTSKRIPPVPAAPDLTKLKFGGPISLFNGKDLTGWRVMNPKATNGWSVADGVLINRVEEPKDKAQKSYAAYTNLRTDREFTDFNLTLETRVPKDGNSGVFLRGVYEVQVFDSYGKPLDSHNMGALYGRIKPTANAEKPAGEWQTLDITLVDRNVTVILNGTKIIDNQPVLGITGGAIMSDEFKPGPIYLQGDHTGIEYRNLIIRPVTE